MNNSNGSTRGSRNTHGSKKRHVCGVVVTHKGANRAVARRPFRSATTGSRNHHSANRPRVGDTRAFHPAKWKAKQRKQALVETMEMEMAA